MNCIPFLIISTVALLVNGHTNDQYLLCKPVSSAFEPQQNKTVLPVNNCGPSLSNARPGKRGARGLQGVQGPPGPPGIVDCEQINSKLRMELGEIKRQLKCRDGVIVGALCYRLLYSVGIGVVYDKARDLCLFHGGALAETPTKEAYDAVYDYVKTTFTMDLNHQDRGHMRVWLGSMYRNGNVMLSNGRRSYASWYPAHPVSETRRTHMGIHVKFQPDDPHYFGMFNIWPTYDQVAPLCQFLLE